jgi:heat shock protein HtpX
MEKHEVEAVLAHEIAHVTNGDMVTLALIQGVVNTFVIFFARIAAYAVQTFLSRDREGGQAIGGMAYYLTAILFEILFGIIASIIVMWFSRHREFRADAGSARLMGSPRHMIDALKRLGDMHNLPIDNRSKALAAFKINGEPNRFLALFSSHPPLATRIEALKKFQG